MTSLRRNFSWALAGNVVYAGCQWLTLAALTRAGTPALVGWFVAGVAVTAPIVLLSNLALRNVQATDARGQFAFGDYLGLRLLGCALATGAIALELVIRGDHSAAAWAILLVGASKIVEAVSDIAYGLFQQRDRQDLGARSLVARGLGGTLAFAITIFATHRLELALAALTAVWLVVLVAHDLPLTVRLSDDARPRWHRATLVAIARMCWPLGLVTALVSLNVNLPRYFVESELGDHALGVFGAISYFLVVVSLVIVALAQATGPRLSRLWAAGERAPFWRLVWRVSGLGAAVGALASVGALAFGGTVLRLALGPEYADQAHLLALVMASAGLSAVAGLLGVAATATRAFGRLLAAHALVTATTVALSTVLISRWSLLGAGWTLVVSAALSTLPPLWVLHGAPRLEAIAPDSEAAS